ncbi:hypothetical protein QCA50_006071 [Cerrena zonata]|uniref:Serine aminopeptidase S33 domain-containing protein n=1 Tax=Cerrena zonata TaxID=2478898 RepID=A0AAW0GBP6_9APHY
MPRHSVFVSEQLEDYRTVIKFCRQQSDFDPQRVILWGTSFSGGHVVALADERNLNVRLVISQCPYLGSLVKHPFNIGALKTYGYAILDLLKQALGLSPVYIPVTAEPGQVGILTSPGTVSGMSHLAASEDIYPNEISASSLFEVPFYKPSVNAKKIDCPLLLVVPKYDNICDIREAASITRDVPNSELVKLDGGHFDVYPGKSVHDASLAAQVTFLHKYVPV